MSAGLHISISAETLFYVAGIPISNSMLTSLVVSGLIIVFAFIAKTQIDQKDVTGRPKAFQNFCEVIVGGLYEFVNSITHNRAKTVLFLPFITSFFLFILMNNWFGLLPGVGTIGLTHEPEKPEQVSMLSVDQVQAVEHEVEEIHVESEDHEVVGEEVHAQDVDSANDHATEDGAHGDTHADAAHKTFIPIFRAGTADLNTTLALAVISVFMVQVWGIKFLSLGYFKKFINFSNPIMFFVGILEIISEFAKIISFAFRLFGNVFAGEVLLAVIAFLVPVILPMPFYGLEIFVGFIQALVFAMLSLVFFNMATVSHDDH